MINEEHGRPLKKFKDNELQELLNKDDTNATTTRRSIKCDTRVMGKIQKIRKWALHELNERQQENQKTICEMLLARY